MARPARLRCHVGPACKLAAAGSIEALLACTHARARPALALPTCHNRRVPTTGTYINYASYASTSGLHITSAEDNGQSFQTGASGPYLLTTVQLRLRTSSTGSCATGCTLRIELWNANSADGVPTTRIYTENFSPTLTSEGAPARGGPARWRVQCDGTVACSAAPQALACPV